MSEKNNRLPALKPKKPPEIKSGPATKLLLIVTAIGSAAMAISYCSSKEHFTPDDISIGAPEKNQHDKEQNNYLSAQEITPIYKRGIKKLKEKARAADNKRILNLLDMYEKSAVWSDEINGDTRGKNYEDGLCTVSVLMQDDPEWHIQKPLIACGFKMGEKDSVIQIKPHDITDIWASIVFIHELEHVRTRTQDPSAPPNRINDEITAYAVEMEAMELMSDGKFYAALDRMIRDYRIENVNDIAEMLNEDDLSRFKSFCSVMQKAITNEPYKSRGERILIHGVCPIAAGMRMLEQKSGFNMEQLNDEKSDFLKKIWNTNKMRQFH